MAFNSFKKRCSSVLAAQFALRVVIKKGNLAHNYRFLLQTKHEATDKTFGAMFPEGIDGHILKTTKMIQKINAP